MIGRHNVAYSTYVRYSS